MVQTIGGVEVRRNNVQRYRESLMMSKTELARKAGLSSLTVDRVESGRPCRLDTKRKILFALGLRVSDKDQVFVLSPAVSGKPAVEAVRADDDYPIQ
jgi:DNA-binding XRE family transcriptional regulator